MCGAQTQRRFSLNTIDASALFKTGQETAFETSSGCAWEPPSDGFMGSMGALKEAVRAVPLA